MNFVAKFCSHAILKMLKDFGRRSTVIAYESIRKISLHTARITNLPPPTKKRKVVPSNSFTANKVSDVSTKGLREKLGDSPLRLIIIGHNPSDHAWTTGHYYSNPNNRMWPILKKTGIAPAVVQSAYDDDLMLPLAGIGFTDVGCGVPGTDSSQFRDKLRKEWTEGFLDRLRDYLKRSNEKIGCICGECGAPRYVAFVGKSQFIAVFNAISKRNVMKTVECGKQTNLPEGWPFPQSTEVWVLPSTSGIAAMTNEERERPFMELAEKLKAFPWKDRRVPNCLTAEHSPKIQFQQIYASNTIHSKAMGLVSQFQ